MQNIQEVYNRILEAKQKQKDLKNSYNDALKNTQEYIELVDKIKELRERKKSVKERIDSQFASELMQIEDLKIDIESDTELLTDIAMSEMLKGNTVQVKDKFGNQYEPIFKVKFKKQ